MKILLKSFKRNKFKATRTGDGFPSKLEKAVYVKLKDREVLGLIKDIKRQQVVILQEGDKQQRITWKVDFSFVEIESGKTVYCEAKGIETMDFKIKLKLWRAKLPYDLEIWKGDYRRPFLKERISCDKIAPIESDLCFRTEPGSKLSK